ncbi:hypothetical protein J2X69_002089 [Algoriphagus sp. 4150]|uniref:hypothetical protein n=1 Tax=Algoriphagus sp. 4150 TaxID=2817756 RepID=UPI0028573F2C|nr:hypothetical protein [Algoriphagus sp. 4150]MDR7129744.1 hypothetical protein [Algoriphagus sp. 4150]
MKKYFILLFSLSLFISCKDETLSQSELVTEYYDGFNSSDFKRIISVIADSITIIEGEYIMPYSQESFYEQFKWDSIFQSTYEIVELKTQNNQVIATVASSSKRYEFLKNNPLTCKFKISFNFDKIMKLESLECLNADWNIWQTERDSLVNWTIKNHPELDGFIHDLTMNGAINYLKAIELYEKRKDAL